MKHVSFQATVACHPLEGIQRRSLVYNADVMTCHFHQKAGARIPMHDHVAVQAGFVIRGRLQFFLEGDRSFVAETGDSYLFESSERHGSLALEESEVIEVFSPSRPEYES